MPCNAIIPGQFICRAKQLLSFGREREMTKCAQRDGKDSGAWTTYEWIHIRSDLNNRSLTENTRT